MCQNSAALNSTQKKLFVPKAAGLPTLHTVNIFVAREFPVAFQYFYKLKFCNLFAKKCKFHYIWIADGLKFPAFQLQNKNWLQIQFLNNFTRPVASRAFLSWAANPVSILACTAPDKAKKGRKHIMTKLSFQLK